MQDVSIYVYLWGPSKAMWDLSAFPLRRPMVVLRSRISCRDVEEMRPSVFMVESYILWRLRQFLRECRPHCRRSRAFISFCEANGPVDAVSSLSLLFISQFLCQKYPYHISGCLTRWMHIELCICFLTQVFLGIISNRHLVMMVETWDLGEATCFLFILLYWVCYALSGIQYRLEQEMLVERIIYLIVHLSDSSTHFCMIAWLCCGRTFHRSKV